MSDVRARLDRQPSAEGHALPTPRVQPAGGSEPGPRRGLLRRTLTGFREAMALAGWSSGAFPDSMAALYLAAVRSASGEPPFGPPPRSPADPSRGKEYRA